MGGVPTMWVEPMNRADQLRPLGPGLFFLQAIAEPGTLYPEDPSRGLVILSDLERSDGESKDLRLPFVSSKARDAWPSWPRLETTSVRV